MSLNLRIRIWLLRRQLSLERIKARRQIRQYRRILDRAAERQDSGIRKGAPQPKPATATEPAPAGFNGFKLNVVRNPPYKLDPFANVERPTCGDPKRCPQAPRFNGGRPSPGHGEVGMCTWCWQRDRWFGDTQLDKDGRPRAWTCAEMVEHHLYGPKQPSVKPSVGGPGA